MKAPSNAHTVGKRYLCNVTLFLKEGLKWKLVWSKNFPSLAISEKFKFFRGDEFIEGIGQDDTHNSPPQLISSQPHSSCLGV